MTLSNNLAFEFYPTSIDVVVGDGITTFKKVNIQSVGLVQLTGTLNSLMKTKEKIAGSNLKPPLNSVLFCAS